MVPVMCGSSNKMSFLLWKVAYGMNHASEIQIQAGSDGKCYNLDSVLRSNTIVSMCTSDLFLVMIS